MCALWLGLNYSCFVCPFNQSSSVMCQSKQLINRGGEAPVGLRLLRVQPRCHTLQPLFVEISAQYSFSGKVPPPPSSGALRDLLAALRSTHVCWCLWLECITKEPISSSDNNQIFLSSQHAPAANCSGVESCMASAESVMKVAFLNVYCRFIRLMVFLNLSGQSTECRSDFPLTFLPFLVVYLARRRRPYSISVTE